MPFKPGQSGNRKGRAVGSKHKSTLLAQQLLDGEAETITRKAIELAKAGDVTCIRLCLERLLSVKKDHPVRVKLPAVTEARELPHLVSTILQLVAGGTITPTEGRELCAIVESGRKVLEIADLQHQIDEIKEMLNEPSKRNR